MSTDIENVTKKRLIYVKKLYLHGHEHMAYGTEFDRMIAIHHFDNAVELLLKCVTTKYDVSFKRPDIRFPELWNEIDKRYRLPKQTEMFQLHSFRSNVQHWGVSPFSSELINRFDVYVLDFLREVCEQVFGLHFEELFISSLIEDTTLRKILITAEKEFEKGDYKNCIRFADAAFNKALECAQRREVGFPIPSPRDSPTVEHLLGVVSILKLGIDYREYEKYQKFAPCAHWDEKKETIRYPMSIYEIMPSEGEGEKLEKELYSRENALFCLNFVVDCILHWHL